MQTIKIPAIMGKRNVGERAPLSYKKADWVTSQAPL